jgi:hypothetical protein
VGGRSTSNRAAIVRHFSQILHFRLLGIKSISQKNFNILRLFALQATAILSHSQTFRRAFVLILGMHSALVQLEQICME